MQRRDSKIGPLKSTEVLVKVHAVSLQYRDLLIARGTYMPYKVPLIDGLVPASDMAGEIISLGSDVRGWAIGDHVCANFCHDHLYGDPTPETVKSSPGGGAVPGVLTQFRSFPAHALVAIPGFLSYEEASTLPCAAVTAYNALNGPVRVKAGDYVLFLGTGGVSVFGIQFALAAGAIVIVTSSSDEKLQVVRTLGAQHTINYETTKDWDEEVLKITSGHGVDHVVEIGGGTLPKSLNSVRMGGSIHFVGHVSPKALSDDNPLWTLPARDVTLRGITLGSVSMFKDMLRLILAHPQLTKPIVDRVFPFEDVIEAYAYLESQQHVGKVVIRIA